MDTSEVLQFVLHSSNLLNQLLSWYYNNVIFYPALLLLVAIVLQWICHERSSIRYYACYATVFLFPAVPSLVLFPYFMKQRPGMRNCLHGSYVLKLMNKLLGIKWQIVNGHYLEDEKGSAVIVANHQSLFDVLGLFEFWHIMGRCTVIARRLLFWVWPFGLMAWRAGIIFINRKSQSPKTIKTITNAGTLICQQKAKLLMFPEGTRNKNPSTLLPFKKGAFRLAIECQIPIIPMVFSPYYFIDKEKKQFRRGKAVIHILEPIPTKGLTLDDLDDLIEKVYKLMSEKNTEIRKYVFSKQRENGTLKN